MRVPFVAYDVFTSRRFAGNPLLVVRDGRKLSTSQMQSIAREINWSESTFVLPPEDPANAYLQRTFVPAKEIPYAGHPTVGTAFAMADAGRLGALADGWSAVTIEVGFGPLRLELLSAGGRVAKVRMEQGVPSWEPPVTDGAALERVAAANGLPASSLGGALPLQVVSTGNRTLVVPVASVGDLSEASADPRRLLALEREHDVLIVYLFTKDPARPGHLRARAFCTGAGVPEDPATGSAAGPLAAYLLLHGATQPGEGFTIHQGLEMGRPSEIEATALGAPGRPEGVRVAGTAVRTMEGWVEA